MNCLKYKKCGLRIFFKIKEMDELDGKWYPIELIIYATEHFFFHFVHCYKNYSVMIYLEKFSLFSSIFIISDGSSNGHTVKLANCKKIVFKWIFLIIFVVFGFERNLIVWADGINVAGVLQEAGHANSRAHTRSQV